MRRAPTINSVESGGTIYTDYNIAVFQDKLDKIVIALTVLIILYIVLIGIIIVAVG